MATFYGKIPEIAGNSVNYFNGQSAAKPLLLRKREKKREGSETIMGTPSFCASAKKRGMG